MTMQPDPDPENRTLVEREGVNAGSDRTTDEGDHDVVSPPATSQSLMSEFDGRPRELDEAGDLLAPDADAVESGQDDGSMS